MKKKENKTDLAIGVLIGAVIVLGFFAFTQQQYGFGYKTMPTGMHSTNGHMGGMMMPMMQMQNMQHEDANSDGKCDMCGMDIEMCKAMMK